MNDFYSISTFFIFSFESQFIVSSCSYTYKGITLFNCYCNLLVKYSYDNSCFLKKDCSCDIRFPECWFRTQSQERKRIIYSYVLLSILCSSVYVFLSIYIYSLFFSLSLFICLSCLFWYTRFSFRNLKDTNSFMFLWHIATSSPTTCSWCDMTYSQFVIINMRGNHFPPLFNRGGPGKFQKNTEEGYISAW